MTPAFRERLKIKLAPLLRGHGFSGSGVNFRRHVGDVIQVLNIQGSRYGGSCCVNLAVHLTFLPTVLGDAPDPKKITESLCEFRKRLAPDGAPAGRRFGPRALPRGKWHEPYLQLALPDATLGWAPVYPASAPSSSSALATSGCPNRDCPSLPLSKMRRQSGQPQAALTVPLVSRNDPDVKRIHL